MDNLKFKKQTGDLKGYQGNGIYIDKAEVISIEDLSGSKADWQTRDFDLNLKITCKLDKNDWDRDFYISGNFKRDDKTSEILGWGGCFKIMNFLINIDVADDETELTADHKILKEILIAAKGKKLLLLSYPNEKGKSSTWDQVESVDTDEKKFLDYFMSQWEKSGYPKNYLHKNAYSNTNTSSSPVSTVDGNKI